MEVQQLNSIEWDCKAGDPEALSASQGSLSRSRRYLHSETQMLTKAIALQRNMIELTHAD
jgi:hypothetical protein